jgi:hypothetical protein
MSSTGNILVTTIETLLLARYAEAAPDGTITMVGAGLNVMLRSDSTADVQLWLAGTLLLDGPDGPHDTNLRYHLRDPDGDLLAEASIDISVENPGRLRIPFVIPVPIQQGTPDGTWEISVAGEHDLRVLSLEVRTAE